MGNWKYYNNYCYFIQPFNILKTTTTNKRGWANKSGNIFSHSVSTSQPYWIYIYHSQGLNLSIKILATRRYHVCIVCNFPVNPSFSLSLSLCHRLPFSCHIQPSTFSHANMEARGAFSSRANHNSRFYFFQKVNSTRALQLVGRYE